MSNTKQYRRHEQGFTLVELAIVLVIIGLIIGGVLVGQDMIKSAEIRATVAQWEGYSAAANTFRDKYGFLPGDINGDKAAEYGLVARTGAIGHGDGNGLLSACAGTAADGLLAGCETVLYWTDLNTMNLVEGWFQTATDALYTGASADLMPLIFPETKIGRGNFWTVFSAQGKNWYQVAGITAVAAGVYTLTNALSPFEAYNIDRKMDDSRPATGGARAKVSVAALNTDPAAVAAGAAGCVTGAALATGVYNQTTEALANTPECQIRIRF